MNPPRKNSCKIYNLNQSYRKDLCIYQDIKRGILMPKANKNENFGYYSGWMLSKNTWIINFMEGSQNIYLLEGDQAAMLIDTGYGQGNLRAYVEKLTDKPVIVVNTHFHLDHYGGNAEWEKVYVADGKWTQYRDIKKMISNSHTRTMKRSLWAMAMNLIWAAV